IWAMMLKNCHISRSSGRESRTEGDRSNDVQTFIGRSRSRRRRGLLQVASFLVGTALLIAGCSTVPTPSTQTASTPTTSPGASATPQRGSSPGSPALKPIDQAALQTLVDTTVRELLVPGAVVLLRPPQGDFTVSSGTTQLGTPTPP